MAASARKRRSSKERELAHDSAFAPVVQAARALIRGLSEGVQDGDEGPEAEFVRGRIEGIESVIVLCQRAGAGELLVEGEQVLVRVSRGNNDAGDDRLATLERRVAELEARADPVVRPVLKRPLPSVLETPKPVSTVKPKPLRMPPGDDELGACEREILHVLARRRGEPTTNEQLIILTKYRPSGSFSKALANLRADGLIQGDAKDNRITDGGLRAAGDVPPMAKGLELVEDWCRELGSDSAATNILRVLVDVYPSAVDRGELLERTGYADSGSFSKALAVLRKLNLASKTFPMRASDVFFEAS